MAITDRNSVFLSKKTSKGQEPPQNVDALAFLVNNFDKQNDGMSFTDPVKAFPNLCNTGNTPHFVPQTSNSTSMQHQTSNPNMAGYMGI